MIDPFSNLALTETGGTLSLTYDNAADPTLDMMFYAVANVSAGRDYVKNLLKLVKTTELVASPFDPTGPITGRFGSLVSGTKVVINAVIMEEASGLQSLPQTASVIIS